MSRFLFGLWLCIIAVAAAVCPLGTVVLIAVLTAGFGWDILLLALDRECRS